MNNYSMRNTFVCVCVGDSSPGVCDGNCWFCPEVFRPIFRPPDNSKPGPTSRSEPLVNDDDNDNIIIIIEF